MAAQVLPGAKINSSKKINDKIAPKANRGSRRNIAAKFLVVSGIIVSLSCLIFMIIANTVPNQFYGSHNHLYSDVEDSLYSNGFQTSLIIASSIAFPMFIDLLMDSVQLYRSSNANPVTEIEITHLVGRILLLAILIIPNFLLYGRVYENIFPIFMATDAFKQTVTWSCIAGFIVYLDAHNHMGVGARRKVFGSILAYFIAKILLFFAVSRPSSAFFVTFYLLSLLMCYALMLTSAVRWLLSLCRKYKDDGIIESDEVTVCVYLMSLIVLVIQDIVLSAMLKGGTVSITSMLTFYMCLQTVFSVIVLMLPGRIARIKLDDAKRVMDARQDFIRYISHEIRSPLNTVSLGMAYVEEELKTSKDIPKECTLPVREMIKDMMVSCNAAVSILDDLLTIDKITTGRMQLELQEKDPLQFLSEVCNPYNVSARHKSISYKVDLRELRVPRLPNVRPLILRIDEHKFSQVIRNLLSNAIKFTSEGGSVTVTVSVETYRMRSNGTMVKIAVPRGQGGSGPIANARGMFSGMLGQSMAIIQRNSVRVAANDRESNTAGAQGMRPSSHQHSAAAPAIGLLRHQSVMQSSFALNDMNIAEGGGDQGAGGQGNGEGRELTRDERGQEVKDRKLRKVLKIEVKDSGAGISLENQKKMFKQYMQFNASKLQKGKGSGLGLWISKGIVELHGGKIGVYSEGEGKGTTFFVQVPMFPKRKTTNGASSGVGNFVSQAGAASSGVVVEHERVLRPAVDVSNIVAAAATGATSSARMALGMLSTLSPRVGDVGVGGGSGGVGAELNVSLLGRLPPSLSRSSDASRFESRGMPTTVQQRLAAQESINAIISVAQREDEVRISSTASSMLKQESAIMQNQSLRDMLKPRLSPSAVVSSSVADGGGGGSCSSQASQVASRLPTSPASRQHSGSGFTSDAPSRHGSGRSGGLMGGKLYRKVRNEVVPLSEEKSKYVSDCSEIVAGAVSGPLPEELPVEVTANSSLAMSSNLSTARNTLNRSPCNAGGYSSTGSSWAAGMDPISSIPGTISSIPGHHGDDRLEEKDGYSGSRWEAQDAFTGAPLGSFPRQMAPRTRLHAIEEGRDGASTVNPPTPEMPRSPQSCVSARKKNSGDQAVEEGKSSKGSLRFLVVDDSQPTRKVVSRILTSQKHHVTEACDGAVCLRLMEAAMAAGHPFDIVLLDDNMPNVSGPEAARRLRAMGYQGLIVAITGNVMEDDVRNFKEQGADEVLPKPLSMSALQKFLMLKGLLASPSP